MRYPSWSPDGSKIAFERFSNNDSEVYVMNPDGTGQTNLSNNPSNDFLARWSPDGNQIAFLTGRDGNPEIYVMNAGDGSSQTNLTQNPADDNTPAWKP